jgi:hypothetical protein
VGSSTRQGQALILLGVVKNACDRLQPQLQAIVKQLRSFMEDSKAPIRQAGVEASGHFSLKLQLETSSELEALLTSISELLMESSNVKVPALNTVKLIAKKSPKVKSFFFFF